MAKVLIKNRYFTDDNYVHNPSQSERERKRSHKIECY